MTACQYFGCPTRPRWWVALAAWLCSQHAALLQSGDTTELVAESARLAGAGVPRQMRMELEAA